MKEKQHKKTSKLKERSVSKKKTRWKHNIARDIALQYFLLNATWTLEERTQTQNNKAGLTFKSPKAGSAKFLSALLISSSHDKPLDLTSLAYADLINCTL